MTDLLSAKDYHCLVCLLCSDFPLSIIEKTARLFTCYIIQIESVFIFNICVNIINTNDIYYYNFWNLRKQLFLHRIILIDDALDCLISFSDFVFAFQIEFCFNGYSYLTIMISSSLSLPLSSSSSLSRPPILIYPVPPIIFPSPSMSHCILYFRQSFWSRAPKSTEISRAIVCPTPCLCPHPMPWSQCYNILCNMLA